MRVIKTSPKQHYGACSRYCRGRAKLATNDTTKWFWVTTEMRFELCRNATARIMRFKNKPWRHPQFLRL